MTDKESVLVFVLVFWALRIIVCKIWLYAIFIKRNKVCNRYVQTPNTQVARREVEAGSMDTRAPSNA